MDTEEGDLTEEDLKNIAKETMKNKEEVGEGEQELEKFIMSEECELVTLMSVIKVILASHWSILLLIGQY